MWFSEVVDGSSESLYHPDEASIFLRMRDPSERHGLLKPNPNSSDLVVIWKLWLQVHIPADLWIIRHQPWVLFSKTSSFGVPKKAKYFLTFCIQYVALLEIIPATSFETYPGSGSFSSILLLIIPEGNITYWQRLNSRHPSKAPSLMQIMISFDSTYLFWQ